MKKEEIREIIRTNLINLRTSHGLTQTEVGKKVDKTKTAVASWEQGLSLPDATTLYDLSKIYGVSLDYFYEKHTGTSVDVINENFDNMNRNIKKKDGHRGVPRQVTEIHPVRHKYSTQRPKIPTTLKVVVIDDNGEARIVEIESTAIVAKGTIDSPHSKLDELLNKMNKKEGGASD